MVQSEALWALTPALSWMFLPPLLTSAFLQALYQFQILTPPSSAAQSQRYKQRAQAFVSVAYFCYTVYAAFQMNTGQSNYYRTLHVDIESDVDAIKRNFRKLARIYHPDKVGASPQAEAIFVEMRRAHDTLVDPTRRWVYDRLGPIVRNWNEASTTQRDLIRIGIRSIFESYMMTIGFFAATSWLFRGAPLFSYWTIVIGLVFFSSECSLLLSSSRPMLACWLLPTHTIHDLAVALRQMHSAVIMASGHIGPHLPTPKTAFASVGGVNYERRPADVRRDLASIRDGLAQHLAQTAQVHQQAARSVDISLLPLRPPPKVSVETVQDAAARAAAHDRPPELKPSAEEETFMHLMGKAVYRSRLVELAGATGAPEEDAGTAELSPIGSSPSS